MPPPLQHPYNLDKPTLTYKTDASKVPPSRFQKRKGSIYAVPGSRDGLIDSNYATKFHEKHREMWKDNTKSV